MARVLQTLVQLTIVGAMLCPAVVQAQQDEERPSLESILEGAVADLAEDQAGGQLGRIRRVEVTDRSSSEVALSVELQGVNKPDRAAIAVEMYDHQLRAIDGIQVDYDPLPQGDGSTTLRVHYAGSGRVFSSAIRVSLVDATTGKPSSHRKKELVREWIGNGTCAPGSSSASSTSLAPSRDQSARGAASDREPQVVEVHPRRVGDTPRFDSAASASGPGRTRVLPVRTPHLSRAPSLSTARPTSTPVPASTLRASVVMVLVPAVDLYKNALQAQWSSAAGTLRVNDDSSNSKGFARLLGKKALHDGKDYEKVIELHPQYTDIGYITGVYKVNLPSRACRFDARAGFLKGVSRTNGVSITVWLGEGPSAAKLVRTTLTLDNPVTSLSAPIPKSFQGKATVLTVMVRANGDSTQDWFALSAPGIY